MIYNDLSVQGNVHIAFFVQIEYLNFPFACLFIVLVPSKYSSFLFVFFFCELYAFLIKTVYSTLVF